MESDRPFCGFDKEGKNAKEEAEAKQFCRFHPLVHTISRMITIAGTDFAELAPRSAYILASLGKRSTHGTLPVYAVNQFVQ
jgi:hypothetical protein